MFSSLYIVGVFSVLFGFSLSFFFSLFYSRKLNKRIIDLFHKISEKNNLEENYRKWHAIIKNCEKEIADLKSADLKYHSAVMAILIAAGYAGFRVPEKFSEIDSKLDTINTSLGTIDIKKVKKDYSDLVVIKQELELLLPGLKEYQSDYRYLKQVSDKSENRIRVLENEYDDNKRKLQASADDADKTKSRITAVTTSISLNDEEIKSLKGSLEAIKSDVSNKLSKGDPEGVAALLRQSKFLDTYIDDTKLTTKLDQYTRVTEFESKVANINAIFLKKDLLGPEISKYIKADYLDSILVTKK